MAKNAPLTIGRLARDAGVNVETVRYYQRRGLIKQPARPLQGFRIYPAGSIERLLFIKRAQELGFTLNEIANLLTLGEGQCASVQGIAEEKLRSVRTRIADLRRLESVLDTLVAQCRSNADTAHCPVVESLLPDTAEDLSE